MQIEQHHILIYSDSLTWGIIPGTRQRLSFDQRWPGVFERALNQLLNPSLKQEPDPLPSHTPSQARRSIRIIENCLNGRRTVWSDPFKAGRDGSEGLAQVIEMHSPLSLVILMLGTNDFQCTHNNNAWLSAQGMAKLIQIVRQAPIEPGMPVPTILVVSPPAIEQPKGPIVQKFMAAHTRCIGYAAELRSVCEELDTLFFDVNSVTSASKVDGIHLDAKQHFQLGQALAEYVADCAMFK